MAIVPVTAQVPILPAAACGSGCARGLWPPGDRPGRVSSPLLVPQPWPSSYHRLRRTAGGDADAGERLHGCVAGGRPVPVGPQGGGASRLPARPPPPPVGGAGGAQLPPPTRGGRHCGVARGRRCRRRAVAWSRMVLQEATTSVFLVGRFGRQRSFLLVALPPSLDGDVSLPTMHVTTDAVVPSVVCSFCLVDDLWGLAPICFSPASLCRR